MRKNLLLVLALTISIGSAWSQTAEKLDVFFKLSDYYLKRHVYNGLVNYQYSIESRELVLLYKNIGEMDLSNATEAQKKAFYINTYNLLVIYQVTRSYPLERPLDKEGFFDNTYHMVAGERLTLNELEQKMLTTYDDARFHFVLACAAMSCPKLYNQAYTPENVDKLLEERTRLAVNDGSFIRVNQNASKVEASKIFEWYKGDFQKGGKSILDFINTYRTTQIPSSYLLAFYEYDWKLNERKP